MAGRRRWTPKRRSTRSTRSSSNIENVVIKIEESEVPVMIKNEVQPVEEISTANSQETFKCGSIQLSFEFGTKVYNLQCEYCEEKFLLPFWETFIDHMENHQQSSFTEQTSSVIVKTEDEDGKNESHDNNNDEDIYELENMSNKENSSEYVVSEDSEYEPKKKKQKTNTNKTLISFENTEKECIIGFLGLLESHPILWLPRQSSSVKAFDEALIKVMGQFNDKWPNNSMNRKEMHRSISKVKDLYNNSSVKLKYPEYFKLCKKIDTKSQKSISNKNKKYRMAHLPFQCKKCTLEFQTAGRLSSHEKRMHGDKEFTCLKCSKNCKSSTELIKHVRMKHPNEKHVCETCGKCFYDTSTLREHKVYHEPPKNECTICGKRLYSKTSLANHLKSHENSRQYECEYCFKTFNYQDAVRTHERNVHNIVCQRMWVYTGSQF